jgi:DNA polymerase-4
MRWSRQILFGDVDAMFASATIVKDPSLSGKPVAVGGPPPRGIIAAASYAVRSFGVHSAMPTAEALRLCPHLILVPPDRPLYRRLHEQMQAVTDRLFPLTEWSSIDEFYADTTSLQTLYPDPLALGRLLKQAIFDNTGLRCTVGVATGKTVAKIAADSHKPDGRTTRDGSGVPRRSASQSPTRYRSQDSRTLGADRTENDRRSIGEAMGAGSAPSVRHTSPLGSRIGPWY